MGPAPRSSRLSAGYIALYLPSEAGADRGDEGRIGEVIGARCDIAFSLNIRDVGREIPTQRNIRAERPVERLAIIGEGQRTIGVTQMRIQRDRGVRNANAEIGIEIQVVIRRTSEIEPIPSWGSTYQV